jgi:hypothetical protein
MTSPHGGVGGPSFTDADFRRMITRIIASPSPPALSSPGATSPGPNSFQQEQAKLRKYFGILGGKWPEPGLRDYANATGVANDGSFRLSVQNEIEENYVLATTGKGTVQPHEDPGEATPGIGPIPNPLSSIVDFLRLLANPHTWIRVGEFAIGAILLAVGTNAALKQGLGSNAPQIKPPTKGFATYAAKALK